MSNHGQVTDGDVHTPFRWIWADATARGAETDIVSSDVNKVGLQSDSNSLWILEDLTPTWTQIGGGGAGTVIIDNVDVTVNDLISFDIIADVPIYPYALTLWLASAADGDTFSPEPNVSPNTPTIPILNNSNNRDLLVGIADSSPHPFAYDVLGTPYVLYICWVNPDGTYSVDGPHTVTPA